MLFLLGGCLAITVWPFRGCALGVGIDPQPREYLLRFQGDYFWAGTCVCSWAWWGSPQSFERSPSIEASCKAFYFAEWEISLSLSFCIHALITVMMGYRYSRSLIPTDTINSGWLLIEKRGSTAPMTNCLKPLAPATSAVDAGPKDDTPPHVDTVSSSS